MEQVRGDATKARRGENVSEYVLFENHPTTVRILKKSAKTDEPLEGITFLVHKLSEEEAAADYGFTGEEETTDGTLICPVRDLSDTAVTQQIGVNMESKRWKTSLIPYGMPWKMTRIRMAGHGSEWALPACWGGFFGGAVIMVCGVSLVLSVVSRLFKLLICVSFAPVAFAGFAGGHEFAQTGVAWLRTFIGYALEAVVIALAISISYGMFTDANMFSSGAKSGSVISLLLLICGYCMPMVTACACVKGAEMTIRRCLGLG